MILAGESWSQQIGLTGFPLAAVIIAIIAGICFWLWLISRS
jgi:hypothetical protein